MKIPLRLALLVAVGATACAPAPDRQWMKTGPYTVEEFQRDTAACSRDGELDADCMQTKGWIAVQPVQPEQPQKKQGSPTYQIPGAR